MFSLFKTKTNEPPTLKTRVRQFWAWYTDVGPRFYETIERGQCASLATEVSTKVKEFFPGFAWVFGPGEEKKQHSFTLSGEGNLNRQLVTRYWHNHAPTLPGWVFYASRQPGSIDNKRIKIGNNEFNPIEFWITPQIDHEKEVIHIVVWHPLFDVLPEKDRSTILYLFLDEVLGEYGTEQWIGQIKLENTRLAEAIPLKELLPLIKKIEAETGWKKYPPGQAVTVYKFKEQDTRFLRGDIIAGTSANMRLVRLYHREQGNLVDPLAGTGADYVFVAFDAKILPKGRESSSRGEIEDALDKALSSASSGQVLGGAYGTTFAYIDLMLFDGMASLEIVQSVLRQRKLPSGTSINFFAKEKKAGRVVL